MKTTNLVLKISVAIAYAAMITVNYLASALPIGGVNTGEASEMYPNLFTPAGITFSIWGLIYTMLLGFTLHQFGLWQKNIDQKKEKDLAVVGRYFFMTSLANIAWIFAWHYGVIWFSLFVMLVLLFFLIKIADVINKERYGLIDTIFIRLPFSVYFGWIMVATIANFSVFLISVGWDGFGIADEIWTMIILLVGSGIGIARMLKDKNIIYGFVLIWAYSGILLKHYAVDKFNGQYPNIMGTIIFCLVLFLSVIGFLSYKNRKVKNSN